jgi:hypothetical protein
MLSRYPRQGSLRSRLKHIWNSYIDVRDEMMDRFAEVHALYDAGMKERMFLHVSKGPA